jgi:hypothetical protein
MIILVSLLIVTAVVFECYLYQPYNIKNIIYKLKPEKKIIVAGEALKLEEVVYNRTPLPFPKIVTSVEMVNRIDEFSGPCYNSNSRYYLNHKTSLFFFQKINVKHELRINKRGVYRAKLKGVNYSDLLMIKENWLSLQYEFEFIVYPQILPIEAFLPEPVTYSGDNFVRRFILEDYFFPSGVRDYITGDNTRHIDWKQTARMGQLKVRTYDYTSQEAVSILLNLQQSSDIWERADAKIAEKIINIGASVLHAGIEEKFNVGLFANAFCIGFPEQTLTIDATACMDFEYLYECTARLLNYPSMNFSDYLKSIKHYFNTDSNLILITAYSDEDLRELLWRMKGTVRSISIITINGDASSYGFEGIPVIKAYGEGTVKNE